MDNIHAADAQEHDSGIPGMRLYYYPDRGEWSVVARLGAVMYFVERPTLEVLAYVKTKLIGELVHQLYEMKGKDGSDETN